MERSVRVLIKRLRATIIGAQLPYYLWCHILPTVLKLINNTAITNKAITPYQALMDNLNPGQNNVPNLGHYKIIRAPCEVLIPSKKRQKAYKLALKTKPGRLLTVLNLKTFLIWVPTKRIMVKTPFIQLKKKALLRDKTAIPKNLSTKERELINLVTNNNGNNNLRKDAAPEKSINNLIISNSNSDPESLEINHYGVNLEAKFWESNFTKQITNLIPKTPNEQHKSISTSLNWLWPKQINPSEPANYYFNNNLTVASKKTVKGANSKGEAIEITSLIRNINYEATKKQTKRPIKKKGPLRRAPIFN